MAQSVLRDLSSARLRANPAYELVPLERLEPDEAAVLADAAREPGVYGVLRPRDGVAPYRSVDEETALLIHTLATPGPVPTYARATLGSVLSRAIADLVLAGILEVEDGGRFVSGPSAHHACFAEDADSGQSHVSRSRTVELSREAVEHAQHLGLDDPGRLALRLYLFNRAPLTPAWQRRLPGPEAVLDYLGLHDVTLRRRLNRSWSGSRPDGWLFWSARHLTAPAADRTFKLYLSPTIEALPRTFATWVEWSDTVRAFAFKVGRDASGLLRPDKFVAYFATFDDLANAARALSGPFSGVPAQGVPFTAGITPDGLLSWGIDPPLAETPEERESWRLWVAGRLAGALVEGARAGLVALDGRPPAEGAQPAPTIWRYALDRLRLDGIDTDTWRPSDTLWRTYLREGSPA